jgi:23S rRNA pseudouridine1911/1915/1917 synthase
VTLNILFEDNHCLVVAKPAGLLTQGVPTDRKGIPTLESHAKAYLKERYHKPGNVYLGVPHRLDRPVSGVVVFARNTKAARRLAEQFQAHQVQKTYWAWVEGVVEPQTAEWEDWLLKIKAEARSEIAPAHSPGARRAILHMRRLATDANRALLEIHPITGRMHQIRVQAASRGHPILGDFQYGALTPFGPTSDDPRGGVIALHARSIRFLHPISYQPTTVEAPLPDYWSSPTTPT